MNRWQAAESRQLILLGAGGHAKVLLSLAQVAGLEVVGICDPELVRLGEQRWRGIEVLGGDDALASLDPASVGLINGIGQVVGGPGRLQLFARMKKQGFYFPALVHPGAWVDTSVILQEGAQIMAGVIIQPDVVVGTCTIVNTCASIDHDCHIGDHVHIAPGATLCGGVHVGAGAFVASGATVLPGRRVGQGAVVGAGVVLTRDLAAENILIGSPSRLKE